MFTIENVYYAIDLFVVCLYVVMYLYDLLFKIIVV